MKKNASITMSDEQSSPQNSSKPPRRRWFQFSLRTMIVATAMIAILTAWISSSERQRKIVEQIDRGHYHFFGEDYMDGIARNQRFRWTKNYYRSIEQVVCYDDCTIDWSKLPKLRRLDCTSLYTKGTKRNADSIIDQLAVSKSIVSLNLQGLVITDVGMKKLTELDNLDSLTFDDPQCNAESFLKLKNAPNLRGLVITIPRFTSETVAEISQFPKLEQLDIKILPSAIPGLEKMKNLTTLRGLFIKIDAPNTVERGEFADKAMQMIQDCSQLRELYSDETELSNVGLSCISKLENLRTLVLRKKLFDREGLTHLKKLSNLEVLNLIQCNLKYANFDDLTHLKKLKTIFLFETELEDSELKKLAVLSELQEIHIDVPIDPTERLKILIGFPKLKEIHIANRHYVKIDVDKLKRFFASSDSNSKEFPDKLIAFIREFEEKWDF